MNERTVPQANVKTAAKIWKSSRLWWLSAVCAVVAIVLSISSISGGGLQIGIRFLDGHGIKPGDTLRYRGIDIGEVEAVELAADLKGVRVVIRLDERAESLASEGSRFWIARPQVGLARVSGLETVVGAKYIGVLPGPANRPATIEFKGIESPPLIRENTPTEITVRFYEGYGLTVGDAVKHRGIDVGEITSVTLNADISGIEVRVRLASNASGLAVAGTRFWIERPRVAVAEVRGLETLVGGRYLAVAPGPTGARPLYEFDGLEIAPAGIQPPGGLEIILESQQRDGLSRGAPVLYRGLPVGHVVAVSLSPDAANVEARVYIAADYKSLIRAGTVFWRNSGVSFKVSLSEGIELNTDTLSALTVGGVALATPTEATELASTGQRFPYFAKMPDDVKDWQPRIAVGNAAHRDGLTLPQPHRAVLRWTSKSFGFQRERQIHGWIVALSNGGMIGPNDLLTRPEGAIDDSAILEAGGATWEIHEMDARDARAIGTFQPENPIPHDFASWPVESMRTPDQLEDMLLVADTMSAMVPLLASRVTVVDGDWIVDPSLSLDAGWHGACAVSQTDGKLIGVIIVNDDGVLVARVRPD